MLQPGVKVNQSLCSGFVPYKTKKSEIFTSSISASGT